MTPSEHTAGPGMIETEYLVFREWECFERVTYKGVKSMIRRQMNKLVMAVVERDLAVALIRREQVVLEVILRELVVVIEAVAVVHHRQARPVEVVVEAVVPQEEEVVVEVVAETGVLHEEEEVAAEAVDLGEPM